MPVEIDEVVAEVEGGEGQPRARDEGQDERPGLDEGEVEALLERRAVRRERLVAD